MPLTQERQVGFLLIVRIEFKYECSIRLSLR
jgi:hypothetical protein